MECSTGRLRRNQVDLEQRAGTGVGRGIHAQRALYHRFAVCAAAGTEQLVGYGDAELA